MTSSNFFFLEICHRKKRLYAWACRLFQNAQSLLYNLSILPYERYDISDCAQSDDIEVAGKGSAAQSLPKRLTKLERHAHAGDILIRIRAVCAMRIYNGER